MGDIDRAHAGEEPSRCQLGRGPLPPCLATRTCPTGDGVGTLPEGRRAHLLSTSLCHQSSVPLLGSTPRQQQAEALLSVEKWEKPFSLFSCHPARCLPRGPPLCHLHPRSQLSADPTFSKTQTLVTLLIQGCPPLLQMPCSLPELVERHTLLRSGLGVFAGAGVCPERGLLFPAPSRAPHSTY